MYKRIKICVECICTKYTLVKIFPFCLFKKIRKSTPSRVWIREASTCY